MLSMHGTDAAVYAGGTDLLIRLKNRLKQAPAYLVDIKKINNLRYIKEDSRGGVQIGALTKLLAETRAEQRKAGQELSELRDENEFLNQELARRGAS